MAVKSCLVVTPIKSSTEPRFIIASNPCQFYASSPDKSTIKKYDSVWCQKLHGLKTSGGAKPCSPFCIKRMLHCFEFHSYHQHRRGLGKAPTTKTETVGRCIKACNTESLYHKHISAILPVLFSSTNNINLSTTDISNMHHSDAPTSFIYGFTSSPFIESHFTISPFHYFIILWFFSPIPLPRIRCCNP